MKLTSRISLVFAMTVFVAVGVFVPQKSFAVDEEAGGICSRLTTKESTILARIDKQNGKFKNKYDARIAKVDGRRSERDATLAENREAADAKRQDRYENLQETAVTDEQKAAVTAFQNAVESAVTARRASHEAARNAFRSGVDSVLAAQKTVVDNAKATLKTSVAAAFDKAQASCDAGEKNKAVKEVLNADLTAAMTTFKNSVKSRGAVGSQIDALAEVRKQAFEAAKTTFTAALEAAREALRAAISN